MLLIEGHLLERLGGFLEEGFHGSDLYSVGGGGVGSKGIHAEFSPNRSFCGEAPEIFT